MDFKTVIDKKCAEWLQDGTMVQYLRPETLFGTKFEAYLNNIQLDTILGISLVDKEPKLSKNWLAFAMSLI